MTEPDALSEHRNCKIKLIRTKTEGRSFFTLIIPTLQLHFLQICINQQSHLLFRGYRCLHSWHKGVQLVRCVLIYCLGDGLIDWMSEWVNEALDGLWNGLVTVVSNVSAGFLFCLFHLCRQYSGGVTTFSILCIWVQSISQTNSKESESWITSYYLRQWTQSNCIWDVGLGDMGTMEAKTPFEWTSSSTLCSLLRENRWGCYCIFHLLQSQPTKKTQSFSPTPAACWTTYPTITSFQLDVCQMNLGSEPS